MTKEDIEHLCKILTITDYTINDDMSINVAGDVSLNGYGLKKIPLNFYYVLGDFNCSHNELTTLEGSPKKVDGFFACSHNNLTTLEYGPESIGGSYICHKNKLTSLKGCLEEINGNFGCSGNLLKNLEHGPKSVAKNYDCTQNKITSLLGCPESIGGQFFCSANPIGSIFRYVDGQFLNLFKRFKIIKDDSVDFKRLKYIMEMYDFPIFIEQIEKYYKIINK